MILTAILTARRLSLVLGLSCTLALSVPAQTLDRIELRPNKVFFGGIPGFPTSYVFQARVEGTGITSVSIEALSGSGGPISLLPSMENGVFNLWTFHETTAAMRSQWPTGSYRISVNSGAIVETVSHSPNEPFSQPNIMWPRPTIPVPPPVVVQWGNCGGCGGTNILAKLGPGNGTFFESVLLPANATQWTPTSPLLAGMEYELIVATAAVETNTTLPSGTAYFSAFTYDNLSTFVVSGGMVTATETVRLGSPPNPNALRGGLTGAPKIGNDWFPFIDHGGFMPQASVDFLMASIQGPINVPTTLGTLLCLVPPSEQIFVGPAGGVFLIRVPAESSLIGVNAIAQGGAITMGDLQLTNALDLVIGNQ